MESSCIFMEGELDTARIIIMSYLLASHQTSRLQAHPDECEGNLPVHKRSPQDSDGTEGTCTGFSLRNTPETLRLKGRSSMPWVVSHSPAITLTHTA